jgi:hypothetical protein
MLPTLSLCTCRALCLPCFFMASKKRAYVDGMLWMLRREGKGQAAVVAVDGVGIIMGVEGLFGSVVEEQETQERIMSVYA